ncbi:MAG: D-2-hydroxyacid dehydrogenase [Lachnospiraceae bacterium]|nr:D-2-hydroxyacid dehydrogenase [Lachnospiraceae bacterium]
MNIVILDAMTLGDDIDLSIFESIGNLTVYQNTSLDELDERVKDAHVLIVNKVMMNENTLSNATNLKMIALTATGYNNVDLEYAKKRDIRVCNVSGYSTQSVIQHTFALMFYVFEKLNYYDNYVKSGEYTKSPMFTHFGRTFNELYDKTWGIIGLGEIGRGVANVAKAFGANVIYYSTSGKNNDSEYKRVSLEELLETSDIVSIHAPLNEATYHLMNYEAFKQMKKNAVLINVGRGPIINEKDLLRALKEELIAAAALDVLEVEPMLSDSVLLEVKDSDRLVITPHIAWATVEARTRLVTEVKDNIIAFMKGEERNVVV